MGQDDPSVLHLLCTLFLLILHQLHLRSSGICPQRLGAPDVNKIYKHSCYCVNSRFDIGKNKRNSVNQWFPHQGDFAFTGSLGNVWRDIWFSPLGEGRVLATGT